MVFSSSVFLFLFLPLVLYLYYNIPKFGRNFFLLIASLIFYAWGEGLFVLVMLFSITMNYLFGLAIEKFRSKDKTFLAIAVISNLGLLGFYKYANFFVDTVNPILQMFSMPLLEINRVHLPIGISFFTFQALSYVIDVYRKEHAAQKNLFSSALYITLFPQLIAGPIVRYVDVADQINERTVTKAKFLSGVERFTVGLGKKVLLGNPLAEVGDKVYAIPADQLTTPIAWFGIFCWGLHIYFDFSGYSDMAIGLGKMFGFEFLENFNYPYIARSIREYWTRWHISLSTWLKDYLYIPLGGSRKGEFRTYINLIIVFVVCGLWHGAAWNFVIFGMLQGLIMTFERLGFEKFIMKLWRPVGHLYFTAMILSTYAIFRSDDMSYAGAMLKSMYGFGAEISKYKLSSFTEWKVLATAFIGIFACQPLFHNFKNTIIKNGESGKHYKMLKAFYAVALVAVFVASCVMLSKEEYNPFVYFRF